MHSPEQCSVVCMQGLYRLSSKEQEKDGAVDKALAWPSETKVQFPQAPFVTVDESLCLNSLTMKWG